MPNINPAHTFDPEDDSLLNSINGVQGDVVVLSGVGEIAFNCLVNNNNAVHFVSSSIASYHLVILKYVALRNLVPDNVYNLLGVHPSGRRVFVYHQLRDALPKTSRVWWDKHEDWIREGILGSGQFELQYRRWFKQLGVLVGGWPNHKTLAEQQHFIEWLEKKNRWSIFNRFSPKPWLNDWLNTFQHTLIQHNQYVQMDIEHSDNWTYGPSVFTRPGMKIVQDSITSMHVHQQDPIMWLRDQKDSSFSRIVVGTELANSKSILEEISQKLHPLGRVDLWSRTRPSYNMSWSSPASCDRGFYSGRLWQGVIAKD